MDRLKIAKIGAALLVIAILIGALTVAGFFYIRYENVRKNPELISQEEIKSVTQVISQFMDLPTDEEPTLATITDQEKIKDQDFFKKAENGDKILLYQKARKAILFRPSTGRIIEFAPLALGTTSDPDQSSQLQETQSLVSIYNGTSTAGLTDEVERKLQVLSQVKVVAKENAKKADYSETLVIDLSGNNEALATQIAELLGGTIASLPDGEVKPNSELLIIATK